MAIYARDPENTAQWRRDRRRVGFTVVACFVAAALGIWRGDWGWAVAFIAAWLGAVLLFYWSRMPAQRRNVRYMIDAGGVLQELGGGSTGRRLPLAQIRGYVDKDHALILLGRTVAGMQVPKDLLGFESFRQELARLGVAELPAEEARPAHGTWSLMLLVLFGFSALLFGKSSWMLIAGLAAVATAVTGTYFKTRHRTDLRRWHGVLYLAAATLPVLAHRLHWHGRLAEGAILVVLVADAAALLLHSRHPKPARQPSA